jgi:hypothetical protein
MQNYALNRADSRRFVKYYELRRIKSTYAEIDVHFPYSKVVTLPFETSTSMNKKNRERALDAALLAETAQLDAMQLSQYRQGLRNKPKFEKRLKISEALFGLSLVLGAGVALAYGAGAFDLVSNSAFLTTICDFVANNFWYALAAVTGFGAYSTTRVVRDSLIVSDLDKNEFGLANVDTLNDVVNNPKYQFGISKRAKKIISSTPVGEDVFNLNTFRHFSARELYEIAKHILAVKGMEAAVSLGQTPVYDSGLEPQKSELVYGRTLVKKPTHKKRAA